MSASPKPDATKSTTHPAVTALMTPAQHLAVATRLRRTDPETSGEQSFAQTQLVRLHDLVANAIGARDSSAQSFQNSRKRSGESSL